jgi:hypothetical protein
MSREVNPPQTLRTPSQFLNDREATAFFDQQRTILFQLKTCVDEINANISTIEARLDALEGG